MAGNYHSIQHKEGFVEVLVFFFNLLQSGCHVADSNSGQPPPAPRYQPHRDAGGFPASLAPQVKTTAAFYR